MKNIVLIAWDCARRDHCSLYGYDRETTPFLKIIGEFGWVFDQAITQSFWSLPIAMSVFTGKYPSEHGATMLTAGGPDGAQVFKDQKGNTLLPEILQWSGYDTYAYSDNSWIDCRTGLNRGFNHFYGYESFHDPGISKAENVFYHIKVTFKPKGRFFLFVNFLDSHDPYEVPDSYRKWAKTRDIVPDVNQYFTKGLEYDFQELIDRYDEAIFYQDNITKELWNWLGDRELLKDTIFIVYGDHGEYFGEHGLYHHTCAFYDELLRVPLVVWSENRLGQVISNQFELRRLYDLVLSNVFDVPIDPDRLTTKYALAEALEPQLIMWAFQTFGRYDYDNPHLFSAKQCLRTADWKYIKNSRVPGEFYDLVNDPKEQNNIFNPDKYEVQEAKTVLNRTLLWSNWQNLI